MKNIKKIGICADVMYKTYRFMCVCAGIVIDESPKTAGGTYEPSNSQVSVPIFGGIFVKLNQFAVAPGNETWLAGPLDEFDDFPITRISTCHGSFPGGWS